MKLLVNHSLSPDRISRFIAYFCARCSFPFRSSFSSCRDSQVNSFSASKLERMSLYSVMRLTISAI